MKKRVLISDIAKALHISITTVSFILNGKAKEKRISEELSRKVLDYVRHVGYKPNELAKSLRTGKTKIIGLIIEDISNAFFANIARYIEEKAYNKGYRIIYCSTDNDPDKTRELIRMFRNKHVDGYIITPSAGIEDEIKTLLSEQLPVVLFDRYLPDVHTNYVVTHNFNGAYEATVHLAQQGYQKIALVTLESEQTPMRDRLAGYLDALDTHSLQPCVHFLTVAKDDIRNVASLATFFMREKPDAVLFTANYMAINGLRSLKETHLPLPGIVSFDDHVLFRLYNPTITVVSQPIERLASELINTLLKQLQTAGGESPVEQIVLPPQLVIRESSVRKPHEGE